MGVNRPYGVSLYPEVVDININKKPIKMAKITVLATSENDKPRKIRFEKFMDEEGNMRNGIGQTQYKIRPEDADEIILLRRRYLGGDYDLFNVIRGSELYVVLGYYNEGEV